LGRLNRYAPATHVVIVRQKVKVELYVDSDLLLLVVAVTASVTKTPAVVERRGFYAIGQIRLRCD